MRQAQEHTFTSFDGTALFYRAWLPVMRAKKAVVIFHRGHEHSGRLTELAQELNFEDAAVFAWDQRGHGRSPGERGYAEDFYDLVRDVDAFIAHIRSEYKIEMEDIAVIAHSVAAVVVGLWVHDFAPRIAAMVLATPAFQVKLYVPLALPGLRFANWVAQKLGRKTLYVKSYVKGKLLTHDPAQAAAYDSDQLISKQIAVNILLGLADGSKRLVKDAGAIRVPTLLLSARADWVVKNLPQRIFFQRLASSFKKVVAYRGFFHAIFHEKDKAEPICTSREFINEAFTRREDYTPLRSAEKEGFTAEEYAWLSAGLPMISLKRLNYVAQRLMMRTLGRLSKGIALGWRVGFDSGESLNYVYENKATGITPLGKLIDRTYLDSVGWRGIRQRKKNLESLFQDAAMRLKEESGNGGSSESAPLKVVDIAGGPGRYLIDFALKNPELPLDILVRDWSESGLAEGREQAERLGCRNIRFERGDAFDANSLAKIDHDTSLAVVSGLYELFPDNTMVRRSLKGLAAALKSNGYLVYTNQPWHPQLEMIAEVLVNREQQPWIMRRRTQAEMDELVREAGFRKISMLVDNWGIFTVSLAQKC